MGGAGTCPHSPRMMIISLHALFVFTGWLFLFAVLMAAGLLFTMVFFVRIRFSSPTTRSSEHLGTPRRSSCSPTWSAITSTL